MKKFLSLLLLVSFSAFSQSATIGQIHKTVTTAGTPVQLSTTDLYVRQVWFQYSFSNTGATGYVGNSAANAVAAKALVLVKPTATVPAPQLVLGTLQNNASPKINLKDIWVDASSNNDEVNVFYIE